MKKIVKTISISFLVILLAGVFLFAVPSSSAYAEGLNDEPPGNGEKIGLIKQRLEAAFERQQQNLVRQAENIQKMRTISSEAQQRLDALKANGKDVSSLEAALATFNGKLLEINTSHQSAADLVAAHPGFGNNGKVIDIEISKNTLINIHDALKATRQLMADASRELRQALRSFREANKPVPTQVP
jgi:hypothetical protein